MTRIGYVLKVYPRFSETFIVTEILAREAQGDDLRIYALRPTTDARFHPRDRPGARPRLLGAICHQCQRLLAPARRRPAARRPAPPLR